MNEQVVKRGERRTKSDPLRVTLGELDEYRSLLGKFYNCSLPPVPRLDSLSSVKGFCAGALDPCVPHPWRDVLKREVDRMGLAHSLFLFRKRIPIESDSRSVRTQYVRKMVEPSSPSSPDFLRFCRKEIGELFPRGWDRSYGRNVSMSTAPTSACLENTRMMGGVHNVVCGSEAWRSLLARMLGREALPPSPYARVECVPDGGKYRVVTVNSSQCLVLRPLHHTLYNHLSHFPWLLRGDATPSSFRGFSAVPGELFVSGDYEAATDNLPIDLYVTMLSAVADQSVFVPKTVWSFALEQSSKVFLVDDKVVGRQGRGQLMGSYLSFPFLCLANYLAFRYLVPRPCPLRINGDDIVFRASPSEANRWVEGVARLGLSLSMGKTLFHWKYFTLNSSMFKANAYNVWRVPFIRAKAFLSRVELDGAGGGLAGQFQSCVSGAPGTRSNAVRAQFLKRNLDLLLGTQRSVTRGHGMKASVGLLRQAGLWDRERFYLSLPVEKDLPSLRKGGPDLPDGWTRVRLDLVDPAYRSKVLSEESGYHSALVNVSRLESFSLESDVRRESLWARLKSGTLTYPGRWVRRPKFWSWALRYGRSVRPSLEPIHREWVWRPTSANGSWRSQLVLG